MNDHKAENKKSPITIFFRDLILLKVSNRASKIKNTKQAKNAITPIVTPNPHALEFSFNGQVPCLYMASDDIQPKTITPNN
jgi:hypothetical protein